MHYCSFMNDLSSHLLLTRMGRPNYQQVLAQPIYSDKLTVCQQGSILFSQPPLVSWDMEDEGIDLVKFKRLREQGFGLSFSMPCIAKCRALSCLLSAAKEK